MRFFETYSGSLINANSLMTVCCRKDFFATHDNSYVKLVDGGTEQLFDEERVRLLEVEILMQMNKEFIRLLSDFVRGLDPDHQLSSVLSYEYIEKKCLESVALGVKD